MLLLSYILLSALTCVNASVSMAGINIAGCEFGMTTSGVFPSGSGPSSCISGTEAAAQMGHFYNTDGFNVFRIPVAWQQLVDNDVDINELSEDFMTTYYDPILNACLSLGAYCIIDIHNYARWNGGIVGQGGPPSSALSSIWTQLAKRYLNDSKVIFGVMNEPHDLDMYAWKSTVQEVVTAIRVTGANQTILLPGTDFTGAFAMPHIFGPYLVDVMNPDGSTDNLVIDVHQYFDSSGSTESCPSSQTGTFARLAAFLKTTGHQAFVSEIGAGNNDGCVEVVIATLEIINNNTDVYMGWTSWAAGAFQEDYSLVETPTDGVDQMIVAKAFLPQWQA